MNSDELFNEAADILENGGDIPTKTSNRLLAAMLKQTHGEAREAKREAREAKTLASTNKTAIAGLEGTMKIRYGILGGLAIFGGGITSAIVLLFGPK